MPDVGCEKIDVKRVISAVAIMSDGSRVAVRIIEPIGEASWLWTAIVINEWVNSCFTFSEDYKVAVNKRWICDKIEFTVETQIDKDAS